MYEKKTWVNRQSEHPARRKLTPTGNDNEYDVSRAEGTIMEDGDAFDADTMNDMERRVAAGFTEFDPTGVGGSEVTVQPYTCEKTGSVYALTGSGLVGRCKIPAAWAEGDTWTVNGEAVPAYCGTDAVDGDSIVAGRWVLFFFDGQQLNFSGGGGLTSSKLAQATATENNVLAGEKFFAGDKTLKEGTLRLSGNVTAGTMLEGYSGYADDAHSIIAGSMTNRGSWGANLSPGGVVTVPPGYHNGNGQVSVRGANAGDVERLIHSDSATLTDGKTVDVGSNRRILGITGMSGRRWADGQEQPALLWLLNMPNNHSFYASVTGTLYVTYNFMYV